MYDLDNFSKRIDHNNNKYNKKIHVEKVVTGYLYKLFWLFENEIETNTLLKP